MTQRIANIETAVSEEILALMGRRRISQTKLAEHLGINQGTLSKRLRGTQPWTITDLEAVAEFFDVSITALFPVTVDVRDTHRYTAGLSLIDRPRKRDRRRAERRTSVPVHIPLKRVA
jgi:transcriptional regulator with XRE-family HTH domain